MAPGTTETAAEGVEGAAVEVLAGDVLEGLPAGPQVDAVADLGVAGHGSDARILEVRHQVGDGVGADQGIGIDADEDLLGHELEGVIEGAGLAAVFLAQHGDATAGDLIGEGLAGDLGGAVRGAVIDHHHAQVGIGGVRARCGWCG